MNGSLVDGGRRRLASLPVAILAALAAPALAVEALAVEALAAEGPPPDVLQVADRDSVSVATAALLVSDLRGGSLDVQVAALPLPVADAGARVLLLLDVDLASLAAASDGVTLEAAAYALTPTGSVAGAAAADLRLESPPPGLQLALTLNLPPGTYTLRTLVRERGSETLAVDGRTLQVAPPGAPAWTGWLLRPDRGWVVALVEPTLAGWLRAGPRIADLRPVLGPGDRARLRLLGIAGGDPRPTLAARILTADGTALAESQLDLVAEGSVDGAFQVYDASFPVPDLPPGAYRLRLGGADPPTGRAAIELPFTVTGGLDAPPHDDLAAASGQREAAGAYRELLHTLAAGDLPAARRGVRALELAVLERLGSRGLLRLVRSEQALMARLARQSPGALPALVLLHASLLEPEQGSSAVLEAYTVSTLELLARLSARHVTAADDRPVAARALAVGGSALQRIGWHDAAERVHAAAIGLDGACTEALLGAAAGHEKSADYVAAVDLLSALAAAAPDAEEPRLRLALNLIRAGDPARGSEILRGLATGAREDWVSILAFQEAVRREPDPGRAQALLLQGLTRWPDEPGLLLQLAQRRGRTQSPTATAALLQPLLRASAAEASPRSRYNRWPRPAEAEPSGLEALAAWLASETGAP